MSAPTDFATWRCPPLDVALALLSTVRGAAAKNGDGEAALGDEVLEAYGARLSTLAHQVHRELAIVAHLASTAQPVGE